MIFSPINLRHELEKEKVRQLQLLKEAKNLLAESVEKDKEIMLRLKDSSGSSTSLHLIDSEKENIFSLGEIRSVCIRYRLRFLDTALFRSSYPYEAITAIKAFEKKYNTTVESFRIVAPGGAFKLENINKDPLLFVPLSENSFYLIHQWGNNLTWYRRILTWPFQNLKTLLISLLLCSFLFSFSLPAAIMNIINVQSEIFLRLWLTIHTFIGLFGIILWLGISYEKTFSSLNWNSKFYNS
jgi:hypothetical protein